MSDEIKRVGGFTLSPSYHDHYVISWDREEGDNRAGRPGLVVTSGELADLKELLTSVEVSNA